MKSRAAILVLTAALLGAADSAYAAPAADNSFDEAHAPLGMTIEHSSVIRLDGEIDAASPERFRALLESAPAGCFVYLNSSGGDVVAALTIGRTIRARSCKIMVAQPSSCASACVFVLAGGVDREVYGRIGIHRPRFEDAYFAGLSAPQAREKYQQLEAATQNYLRDMGMSDDLFTRMIRIPSYSVQWLTRADIANFGLEGIDPAYEEWLRAQYVQRFGPDGYRRHLEGLALINECYTKIFNHEPDADPKCKQDVPRRYPELTWWPSTR